MYRIVFCYIIFLLSFPIIGQENANDLSFAKDFSALEKVIQESKSYDSIIQRIYEYEDYPEKAKVYIDFLQKMIDTYRFNLKDRDIVQKLKADYYFNLAWENTLVNPKMALSQLDSSDQIAREIGFQKAVVKNIYGRGEVYRFNGQYNKALGFFREYLDYYTQNVDSLEISNAYYQIGNCLYELGKYESALEFFLKSAQIEEKYDLNPQYAYTSIGLAYENLKYFSKSEEFYKQALKLFEKNKDTIAIVEVLSNIGSLNLISGHLDTAKLHLKRAISLSKSKPYYYASSLSSYGQYLSKIGKIDSAFIIYNKALDIFTKNGNETDIYKTKRELGYLYLKVGQKEKGNIYLQNALTFVKENNLKPDEIEISKVLAKWYSELADHKTAFEYSNRVIELHDSILNSDLTKSVAEMSEKYESEKKDREIESLKTEKQLRDDLIKSKKHQFNILFIGTLLLLVALIMILNLVKKLRKKNRIIQLSLEEREHTIKEIHHRIRNNLQNITSLLGLQTRVLHDEKTKVALKDTTSRVRSIALLHENLYTSDQISSVEMSNYINKLVEDIVKFYRPNLNQIDIRINVQNITLDIESVLPIGLIINELLINALKHAFPDNRKGEIFISLFERNELLHLNVKDNGIGIQENGNDHNSYGLKMLNIFQKKLQAEINLDTKNGTNYNIWIANYVIIDEIVPS